MRKLYHYPLSPFSRKVRITMKEKGLDFEMILENFWERRREFLIMNPASQVPVLVEENGEQFSDSTAICEYLEETYKNNNLFGSTPTERAEVRRLSGWFNNKFYYEVTKYIVDEKVYRYYRHQGAPDSEVIRAGKSNMLYHIDYIGYLVDHNKWMAGDKFSMADITAASHLSILDYLGDVPWDHNEEVKHWYSLIKSRPSFRPLLDDTVPSFKPSAQYKDLDF